MDVTPTALPGLWKIATRPIEDERGWFVRTLDVAVLGAHGLETAWPEASEAYNRSAGTLRGLHLQRAPHAEAKLIRCTRGALYDVLVDARPDSPTYGRWEAFELHEDDGLVLYAAPGLAHGYQTLRDATTVAYLHSTPYVAAAADGFRYDSAALRIPWPAPPAVVSDRDRTLPPFAPRPERSRVDS
jgi:dTDP-4-dehydrorhamnose 3,5-epimerase